MYICFCFRLIIPNRRSVESIYMGHTYWAWVGFESFRVILKLVFNFELGSFLVFIVQISLINYNWLLRFWAYESAIDPRAETPD